MRRAFYEPRFSCVNQAFYNRLKTEATLEDSNEFS